MSSKMTPRFLLVREGGMVALPMEMGKVGGAGMFLEWKQRNSVLVSLSLSGIQRHMSGCMPQVYAGLAVVI